MKPFLIFFLLSIVLFSCSNKPESTLLEDRFNLYVDAIRQSDTEKIKAYTYPKLFKIKKPEVSGTIMLGPLVYFNEKISIDSIRKDSLYTILKNDEGLYTVATYLMRLTMASDSIDTLPSKPVGDPALLEHAIGTDQYPAPRTTLMAVLIENQFGVEIIDYKEYPGIIIMNVRVATIAAKDKFAKEWCFITAGNDQELFNGLFSTSVLRQLSTFNKDQ